MVGHQKFAESNALAEISRRLAAERAVSTSAQAPPGAGMRPPPARPARTVRPSEVVRPSSTAPNPATRPPAHKRAVQRRTAPLQPHPDAAATVDAFVDAHLLPALTCPHGDDCAGAEAAWARAVLALEAACASPAVAAACATAAQAADAPGAPPLPHRAARLALDVLQATQAAEEAGGACGAQPVDEAQAAHAEALATAFAADIAALRAEGAPPALLGRALAVLAGVWGEEAGGGGACCMGAAVVDDLPG